jgi:hypothetical protein
MSSEMLQYCAQNISLQNGATTAKSCGTAHWYRMSVLSNNTVNFSAFFDIAFFGMDK